MEWKFGYGLGEKPLLVTLLAELVPLFALFILPRWLGRGRRGWGLSPTGHQLAAGLIAVAIVGGTLCSDPEWIGTEDMRQALVIAPPCAMLYTFGVVYFACRRRQAATQAAQTTPSHRPGGRQAAV